MMTISRMKISSMQQTHVKERTSIKKRRRKMMAMEEYPLSSGHTFPAFSAEKAKNILPLHLLLLRGPGHGQGRFLLRKRPPVQIKKEEAEEEGKGEDEGEGDPSLNATTTSFQWT